MAYENCPQCGTQKHQLVACPQCGFKRMTKRPIIDRELLNNEDVTRQRAATIAPVSSNFEDCPNCGTNKHLLMACSVCGFIRSKNLEKPVIKQPNYDAKQQRYESNPRYPNKIYHHPSSRYETNSRHVSHSPHDNRYQEHYVNSIVEPERPLYQDNQTKHWKRSKNHFKD